MVGGIEKIKRVKLNLINYEEGKDYEMVNRDVDQE